ncbi:MAG: hypothetical protein MUC83_12175 [Pirellula sp.]|nr:hypothetical protein [Pirellula sp.]
MSNASLHDRVLMEILFRGTDKVAKRESGALKPIQWRYPFSPAVLNPVFLRHGTQQIIVWQFVCQSPYEIANII